MKKSLAKKIFLIFLSALVLIVCIGAGFILWAVYNNHRINKMRMHMASLSLEELIELTGFVKREDLTTLFFENKDLIERIRDELFASDFTPRGRTFAGYRHSTHTGENVPIYNWGEHLTLRFNYENEQLRVSESDPDGEKLLSIQNVHGYATEWFINISSAGDFSPAIRYRANDSADTFFLAE